MKLIISILIMCAMLTGCGQANMSETKTNTPAVTPSNANNLRVIVICPVKEIK